MPKKLLSPEAARDFLVRRFNNQHQTWVAGGGSWPLDVSLGAPTEKDIIDDPGAVRSWASAWQSRSGPGEVAFEERQFARLGKHRLPVSLTFSDAGQVAAAVGQAGRWSTAAERYQRMLSRWPLLGEGTALASKFDVLADYAIEDFERLMSLLAWLEVNPKSGLYLRQLPVEGLDTKWLEKRTGLVSTLLRALRVAVPDDESDFHELCGLRKPAHRVRVRLLCPSLRTLVGGLCDIEAPVGELARMPIAPRAVIIAENLETGLALPDVPGAVVVMRLGNAVSALGTLPWLQSADAVYWGDIDTHGFAILDRARRAVPHLRSLLMDESTLLRHRALWVQEATQCPNVPLETLTAEERACYESLRTHTWGQRVRLEQERLAWSEAMETLMQALGAVMNRPGIR
ncbi:Wadjet anti-phage system protein JetD domain-containing protein, partial [Ralstonia solanacearum]|uniref:Wadjet anti-phage system protein JetD domain-containing protein n=1 Tax=Ralstonia solanacearum TaxID=305 RepID=UPI0009C05A9E